MKARLLYRDRDFDWRWALRASAAREAARAGRRDRDGGLDPRSGLPWNAEALIEDLELNTLFAAMAGDDGCVYEVARRVVLTGAEGDLETIRYRQDILRDCLEHPAIVRELYAIAGEAVEEEKKHYLGTLARYPDRVLRWSIDLLEAQLGSIRRLRRLADSSVDKFASEGWTEFFATARSELSDAYIAGIEHHLARLKFRGGVLLGARLGKGNRATGYTLHRPPAGARASFMNLLRAWPSRRLSEPRAAYGFSIHPRDESGFRALAEVKNRGIGIAANALGLSANHVRDFFGALRAELAFYVGCVNLRERLARKGEPICLPRPLPAETRRLSCRGLYDVCLSLSLEARVIGNDLDADAKTLVIVTGANRGGKSTFLRGLGLAQLTMQCGMFVAAESFRSSVCDGLFTHYRREEDADMKSGKLDEELGRMSDIVDHVTSCPMILFNESFAATNEREGSEIARQITTALLERGVRMAFVTHLYEFARGFHEANQRDVLFLRADRRADGTRTFKLIEAEPLATSFGEDLYDKILGDAPTA